MTDAAGRFDFGEQPPREYVLGASLPGKLAAIRRVDLREPAAPREVELVLGDCVASFYGQVTDASSTPIAQAEVLREGVIGTETDALGKFDLCALPTAALLAEIRIVVRADGFGTLALPVAPAGRVHYDFVLAPEATITGRVLDAGGKPITNARVALDLTDPEAAVPPERGMSIARVTDSDGRFRIAGLAAGEFRVAAASAHTVASSVAVTLAAGETREIELRTSQTGVLRGRVIAQGGPVAGVTIATANEQAVSQPDGSFVLHRVPVGDVELATTPYRRTSGPVRVLEGDQNRADIIVERLGVLRGTIRRNGVPVPYARVDISGPSRAGVTADAAGRYEVRGLEPGTYGYYCDDRRLGAMSTKRRALELGPGEAREYDIELEFGGTIAGQVVDERGAPVASVDVAFQGPLTRSHCVTNAAGAFTCSGLAGGTYTPTVAPGSGASHAFRFVDAPPKPQLRDGNARIDGVRLIVNPTLLAIEGAVVDAFGAPVPDVAVRAFGIDRRHDGSFRTPSTITDDDGKFRIAALSAGDYYVEVESGQQATRRAITAGATNVVLVLDRSPCDGTRGHELPPTFVRAPARVVWDHKIELVGWLLPASAKVGAPFEMTLVYRALKPVDREWRVFAHFDSSTVRLNADHGPGIGWCPTTRWQAGETIVDRVNVQFDEPGRYALTIGFFAGLAPNWINLALSAVPTTMENKGQQGAHIADVVVE